MKIKTTPKPQVVAPSAPKVRTTPLTSTSSVPAFIPGTKPEARPVVEQRRSDSPTTDSAFSEGIARIKKSNAARFASLIGKARRALSRARALESVLSVELAVDSVTVTIEQASKIDERRRSRSELIMMIGSDWSELDRLSVEVYMTVTIVPGKIGSLTVPHARHKNRTSPRIVEGFIARDGSDRRIEAIRLKGKCSVCSPSPLRQIANGEQVSSPKARIIYREGDQFGKGPLLEMPDDRHVLTGTVEGQPERLMGKGQVAYMKWIEDRWCFLPYAEDGKRCSDVILFGSHEKGFHRVDELKCEHRTITRPLFTFVLAIEGKQQAMLTGINECNEIQVVDVPWSEDLVEGDIAVL